MTWIPAIVMLLGPSAAVIYLMCDHWRQQEIGRRAGAEFWRHHGGGRDY